MNDGAKGKGRSEGNEKNRENEKNERNRGNTGRTGNKGKTEKVGNEGNVRKTKKKRNAGDTANIGSVGKKGNMPRRSAGEQSRDTKNRRRSADITSNEAVTRNQEYIADVVGLGHDGEGVAKVNGFTLFVRGVLPGEKALIKVTALRKKFGYGQLIEIVEKSPHRVAPPCAIYDACGGCQLQHLSYAGQLDMKRQQVMDSLERIGKLSVIGGSISAGWDETGANGSISADVGKAEGGSDAVKAESDAGAEASPGAGRAEGESSGAEAGSGASIIVHPTIGMEHPWHYRNKAQVPIGQLDGRLIAGFYARGSHRIIDTDECLIQHHENDKAVLAVKNIAQEIGISAYDEQAHRGLLRHVVVKYGFSTGETMVVLVTNGEDIPNKAEFVGLIREELPNVVSICQNINTDRTNVIFGTSTKVLWGSETIRDYIGDVQFNISARSFYQVNPVQTEILYRKAVEYAGLTGEETVIDAYCGIGTISLFLAKHAAEVYGVEIVEEAIEDARRNAELNGIVNATFEVGPAEVVIPKWREDGIKADVIVVDPPRKGCDPQLLETIIEMRPKRVVYVSCNPATLARDLRILVDGGFEVEEVQPVDMFPQTMHVECCVSLVRK